MPHDRSDRFEAILSSLHDATLLLSGEGVVEWVNPAAEELWGQSASRLCNKRVDQLFAPTPLLPQRLLGALADRITLVEREILLCLGPGKEFWAEVTLLMVNYGPEPGGAVAFIRDLTQAKALSRYVEAGERMRNLETLAAGIAHEIKNPLGGVRGAAQLLHADLPPEQQEYTGLIMREVDRINRLMIDFIDLNQPVDFPKTAVNIYPLLDNAIALMTPEAQRKRITLSRHYDPSLPAVIGESDRLSQIFLNVIKNGVEACREGKEVIVATSFSWQSPRPGGGGRYLLVEVIDQGPGLDEGATEKVFTPFYSTKQSGGGLGLALSRRLTRAHGGMIELASRSDGIEGAVASIMLPFDQGKAADPEEARPE